MAQQRARRERVGLLGGDPANDQAPERGERAIGGLEHVAARHLEDDVQRAPFVGLEQALAEAVGDDVDGGVRAQLHRQRTLLRARGGRDQAADPERGRELHGERANAAGRGVHDDALALGDMRGRAVQVPGRQALDQQRERRAAIE